MIIEKLMNMSVKWIILLLGLLAVLADARTAKEWQKRILYQILTDRFSHTDTDPEQQCSDLRSFCGGTFKGIQKRLDYITGLGANAIWISPVVENTPGGYHGYWAKNIFKINPHFGTEDDLKELIAECHKRDVWVMVDVVANHMGYPGSCNWTDTCTDAQLQDYHDFVPFNETEHYHSLCHIRNWNNQTEVELCRLANLPDLNTSHPYVRSTQMKWISDLQKKFNIDGFRVDTPHLVEKPYWREFQSAANVFLIGEVNYGDRENYTDSAIYLNYMDSVLNFPLYWALRKVFNGNETMKFLADSIKKQREAFKEDMDILGVFVDNHDHERFLHFTPDAVLLKNALSYVMITQGIPGIYYGTEQAFKGAGDPQNRESLWPHYNTSSDLYKFIKILSDYRLGNNFPIDGRQEEIYAFQSKMVIGRVDAAGRKLIAVIRKSRNGGQLVLAGKSREKYNSDKNRIYVNVFNSSDTMVVGNGAFGSGQIHLKMADTGLPLIYELRDKPTAKPPSAGSTGTCVSSFLGTGQLCLLCIWTFAVKSVF